MTTLKLTPTTDTLLAKTSSTTGATNVTRCIKKDG